MLGLLAGSLAAQRIPPSAELKKSVNLVEVPVVVRDRKGHAVTNLTRDDFAIYDNEKLQKIALFRYLQPSNGEHASERKLRHEIASANVSSSDGGSSGPSNTEEAEGSSNLRRRAREPWKQGASR